MLKIKLLVAILVFCQSALAADLPSAGGQIQQIPPTPILQKAVPKIQVEQGNAPTIPAADHVKFIVKSLHVTGQTLYTEAKLLSITGFNPGVELTLSEMRGMALKISDHYHRKGYFVAHAYLPQQDIKDGAVTIAVIEGHYGKVTLHNQTNLSDNVAYTLLGGLNKGDVIASAPLERRLLLLSDLPGVEVKSTLVPGVSLGTSDLVVDITPGQSVTGEIDADNAGNRYTGVYRIGATVNFNEPLGYGDVASLRAMTSGSGLYYLRASYQMQLGQARGGLAYSFLGYELGREFANLHANGTAQIASIFGSYPLIRSRNNNLYAGLTFDYRSYQDRVDSTSTVTDKQAQVLIGSLYGDRRDNFVGGGLSSYSLTLTAGNLDIQTRAARTYDAATAKSDGLYSKLGFSAMRLQGLTESISLYGSINGQFAFKNLDVSEKMELGGMYAVRAYPEGEAYADQGFVATLEGRFLLPKFNERLPGQMHLIGFADIGHVTVNKDPWTTEPNNRTLSGAGVGFNWMEYNNFSVKAYYAFKLGNEAATSAPDESGRFWIQLVKYFGYTGKAYSKPVKVENDESASIITEQPKATPVAAVAPPAESPAQSTEKMAAVSDIITEPAKADISNVTKVSSIAATTPGMPPAIIGKLVKANADSTGSGDQWSILVGTYFLEDALLADAERVRKAGLQPVVKPVAHNKIVMNRLFLSKFINRADALAALEKLKRHTPGAFILVQEGKHAVYAGSYMLEAYAITDMERLNAAGFKISLKRARVAMPSQSLTLGPFSGQKATSSALNKLNSGGVEATLVSRVY
jgi:hemolysin activation/secretion protein